MKNYFLLLSVFSFITFTSCSSDDDAVATSLTIAGSSEQVGIGENVSFTVENDLGQDKTEEAIISVNDTPIEANVFSSNETGSFFATATYEDLSSNTFDFSVTNFREYDFNQALVIYQGYINEEIEGNSVDGYAFIVLSYNGQSILEDQMAIENSENQIGFIMITQEDENGNPYYPGESVETEELVNTFLIKENGGEEEEFTNEIEEGNYSLTINDLAFTSEMGGNANYQLELIFNDFDNYTGTFDGDFLFLDASGAGGGGGNPDERPFRNFTQINQESLSKVKNYFN